MMMFEDKSTPITIYKEKTIFSLSNINSVHIPISETITDEIEPMLRGMVKVDPIKERFTLTDLDEKKIRDVGYTFGFGGFSETVYYRTYSQLLPSGEKEKFPDTIVRVVNGIISIRKNWYINHGIEWDEERWSNIAVRMGKNFMLLKCLPSGRGLWICGTKYMYERGAASLNNCGFISTYPSLTNAVVFLSDNLMSGCGLGFDQRFDDEVRLILPGCTECRFQTKCKEKDGKAITSTADTSFCKCPILTYVVHDSREGWGKSLQLLMDSYLPVNPADRRVAHFDYTAIRPKGTPIKGFGGISSGYSALETLHNEIRSFMECYFETKTFGAISATINMCRRRGEQKYEEQIEKIKYIAHINKILENLVLSDEIDTINISKLDVDPKSIALIHINSKDDTDTYHTALPIITFNIFIAKSQYLTDKDIDFIGCDPLLVTPQKRKEILQNFTKTYGKTRLITDICNAVGVCIISANVRRSAEISLGSPGDLEFLNLKNYKLNPERGSIGWMSNNTVILQKKEDFEHLPGIAERIKDNGEPGILNLINTKRYGRVGNYTNIGRENEEDKAIGINPCGEIPLESGEMCNLADIFSSRCNTYEELAEAAELATIYTSTVSLYPTHWANTNAVVGRNHRVGVSFCSIADYHDKHGFTKLTKDLESLYKVVRKTNQDLALEAGVRESIRVTTIKPNGSTVILSAGSSGAHFPCFKFAIRRVRIATDSELIPILHKAGYKSEIDSYSGPGTLVFSFPIDQTCNGSTRPATDVSLLEQSMLEIALARIWSDNSISQTLYFNAEREGEDVERVLAQTCPMVKSLSMLPHCGKGVYPQSPYEEITEDEYHTMKANVKQIDWRNFTAEPIITRGCDGDACILGEFLLSLEK